MATAKPAAKPEAEEKELTVSQVLRILDRYRISDTVKVIESDDGITIVLPKQ